MDLKQVFHNPADLDDSELSVMRTKIRTQMWMPYYGALFAGLTLRILDAQLLKKGACPMRIGAAAILGYSLGAYGAGRLSSTLHRSFDSDITQAFDKRFLNQALNVSGLGSNYTSIRQNEDYHDYSKPY